MHRTKVGRELLDELLELELLELLDELDELEELDELLDGVDELDELLGALDDELLLGELDELLDELDELVQQQGIPAIAITKTANSIVSRSSITLRTPLLRSPCPHPAIRHQHHCSQLP